MLSQLNEIFMCSLCIGGYAGGGRDAGLVNKWAGQ